MAKLIDRFIRYIKIDTESSTTSGTTPSTPTQIAFAKMLVKELEEIGLKDINLDKNGYVMATLPANVEGNIPTIGFIAHMDTSPDMSGKNINPRIVKNYSGEDIILNKENNVILSPTDFPEIHNYIGQDIIVTDGTTLLGADDKAGLSEIVTAMEIMINNPDIKHGKIRIGFTPDEEIGQGADHFNVEKFGAAWAYTIDGGEIGELEYENFNAASVNICIKGRNVHPGTAKNKMINASIIANKLVNLLPADERPEHTTGYEGFYHLTQMLGTVEEATLQYIIRDHDRKKYEDKKELINKAVDYINSLYPNSTTISIKDQYFNMKEKVEPVKHIVDIAHQSMLEAGVTPIVKPIRGGTDGARLSFMGLPCPNIFGGGHNFHGKYEYIPIQSMEKAVDVIIRIAENVAKK